MTDSNEPRQLPQFYVWNQAEPGTYPRIEIYNSSTHKIKWLQEVEAERQYLKVGMEAPCDKKTPESEKLKCCNSKAAECSKLRRQYDEGIAACNYLPECYREVMDDYKSKWDKAGCGSQFYPNDPNQYFPNRPFPSWMCTIIFGHDSCQESAYTDQLKGLCKAKYGTLAGGGNKPVISVIAMQTATQTSSGSSVKTSSSLSINPQGYSKVDPNYS